MELYQEEDLTTWLRSYLEANGYVFNDQYKDGLKVFFTDNSRWDEGEVLDDGTNCHIWTCCFLECYDSPYKSYLYDRKFIGYQLLQDREQYENDEFKELVDRLKGMSTSRTIADFKVTMGSREWERDIGHFDLDFILVTSDFKA